MRKALSESEEHRMTMMRNTKPNTAKTFGIKDLAQINRMIQKSNAQKRALSISYQYKRYTRF